MENSAHTWRLKIFKLFFVYAHRLFCYPPAQKKFFARALRARKIFFFPHSPRGPGLEGTFFLAQRFANTGG